MKGLEALKGSKTYIILGCAFLVLIGNIFGVVDVATAKALYAVFAIFGGVTVSAKINRLATALGKMEKTMGKMQETDVPINRE